MIGISVANKRYQRLDVYIYVHMVIPLALLAEVESKLGDL